MSLIAKEKAAGLVPTGSTASARIAWVYHARGLAILLIVYRHIVLGMRAGGVAVSELMYNLQLVVFNFRMPAFFILSGVFIARSVRKRSRLQVAKDKAGNLLYPYLLWAVITLVLQISFRQFSNARRSWDDFGDILVQPRTLDQLWYLLALFNASMLYLLLSRWLKNKTALHIIIAAALHFLSFYVQRYSLFSDFFYFYLFFYAGALFSDILLDKEARDKLFKTSNFLIILPFFFIGQWFWYTNREETGIIEILFIVINFVGCYVLFNIAMLMAKTGRMEWLAYVGRYSLYVYILHVQVAAIARKLVRTAYPDINPWLLLAICFFCGIILPIVFINLFRRWGVERLFTLQKSREA